MFRPVTALVVLAGCAGDAVLVEVDTRLVGGEVATVELVLSDRVCEDPAGDGTCATIHGPGFSEALGEPGDLYLRDAAAVTGALQDGKALFELPRGSFEMAFAIARDPNNGIVGTAVMAGTLDGDGGPTLYRVELDPTDNLLGNKRSGVAAATQWGEANQCVGIEPLRSTLEPSRPIFILPEDNLDCDSHREANECAPLFFEGFSFEEDPSGKHCIQPVVPNDFNSLCVLGHLPTCFEAPVSGGSPIPCIQSPTVCFPSQVCSACITNPAGSSNDDCVQGKLAAIGTEPRLDCTPPGIADLNANKVDDCGAPSEFVLRPLRGSPPAGAKCQFARLIQDPSAALHSPQEDFFISNGATFTVLLTDPDSCVVKLKWEGAVPLNALIHAVIVVTVDVLGDQRELWLPVNFSFENPVSCLAPAVLCTFVDNADIDSINRCLD